VTPQSLYESLVALPREAGTPAAAEARTLLRRYLQSLGYSVRSQPFSFQTASLNALPILGAGLGWLTVLEIPLLLSTLPGWLAPVVWLVGATGLGMLAWGVGTGVAVPGAERREDANLIASRGTAPVRRWIVAHVDSKAQGHSLAGRLLAVWILVLATVLFTILTVLRLVGGAPLPATLVAGQAGLSLTAGVLAGRGRLKGTSPGARDNGTGVLAALVAAEACRDEGVGFLFTGAEEFGLVGARAFSASEAVQAGTDVVNLDTLTDRGRLYVVFHDERGRALAARMAHALRDVAAGCRRRRLPLGILVDSLPLARAGCSAVTIGRLDWDDLKHLHTARDTAAGVGLATATAVGRAVAELR